MRNENQREDINLCKFAHRHLCFITRQSSILVTPHRIAAPHFKSTVCEPNVILHQTLLYRVERLIFIYTPIKSEVFVVHLIPLLLCVLYKHNSHSPCHHRHRRLGEGFVAIHAGFGEGTRGLFEVYQTSPRAKARRDFSRLIFQQAGAQEGGRKGKCWWPGNHAFERLDSKAGEKGVSIFVMFMKRETQKQKERKGVQGCL